ncbi:MAG: M42 family peptidase [Clostridia bacterium]|nr:M42 family peptidase [Clostridia bacterium]
MLKTLTSLSGVTSWEEETAEYIASLAKPICDSVEFDNMGNLYCFKKGRKSDKKVMLSAHMDEVGFLVKDITDDGYLKFASIGIDSRILLGLRVFVGKNKVPGVIGIKAVHLTTADERKKPVKSKDMYIDIGADSKEEAEVLAEKGDLIVFDSDYVEFGESKIKAKALDDRAGCAALLKLMEEADFEYDTWCVFTVQEEAGLRGGTVAARKILPDLFIALETTTCSDIPDAENGMNVTTQGKGVALSFMDGRFMADRKFVTAVLELGKRKGIACQLKSFAAGGNEVRSSQMVGGGTVAAALSVPTRYLHSPVSVMDKSDYDSLYLMAKEICENLSDLEVL